MRLYVFVMAYITNTSVQETQIHKYEVYMFTAECKQTLTALYFYKLTFRQDTLSFVIYVYKIIFFSDFNNNLYICVR